MTIESTVAAYVDAWNDRDPDAIVDRFAPRGTYDSPGTDGPLTGDAIGDHAAELFESFPDLQFDVERLVTDHGTASVEWTMRGTNAGPFGGFPPTEEAVSLPGTDVIDVADDGLASVRGHFDRETLLAQLGLQVVAQPSAVGPVRFGTSTRLDLGNRERPGAFSLTSITLGGPEDGERARAYTRRIYRQLTDIPGVIGAVTASSGDRGYTITAWEDADAPRRLLGEGAHGEAMEAFFDAGLAVAGATSVWTPDRINTLWVRCPACETMTDAERPGGRCRDCGEPLPEAPPYW